MDPIVKNLKFTFERSTKNTHRYQEVVNDESPEFIGTIYVQRSVLDRHGDGVVLTPSVIYLSIEAEYGSDK